MFPLLEGTVEHSTFFRAAGITLLHWWRTVCSIAALTFQIKTKEVLELFGEV